MSALLEDAIFVGRAGWEGCSAVYGSVLQCVAMFAVCCSVLQCVAVCCTKGEHMPLCAYVYTPANKVYTHTYTHMRLCWPAGLIRVIGT